MNITIKDVVLSAAFVFVGFAFGFPVGTTLERSGSRQRAIEAGVGKYMVSDDKTGGVDFVFIKPEKPIEPEIYQQKAIEASAAFWSIDSKTGEKSFRYFAQQQLATPVPVDTTEKLKIAPQLEKKDFGAAGISVPLPPIPHKLKD